MVARQKKTAELEAAFEPFRKKLTAVEQEVYQVRNRSGQDPLNFPIKLNNKLAALEGSILRVDGKPTAASYEVFQVLQQRLGEQTRQLDAIVQTDVPAMNR